MPRAPASVGARAAHIYIQLQQVHAELSPLPLYSCYPAPCLSSPSRWCQATIKSTGSIPPSVARLPATLHSGGAHQDIHIQTQVRPGARVVAGQPTTFRRLLREKELLLSCLVVCGTLGSWARNPQASPFPAWCAWACVSVCVSVDGGCRSTASKTSSLAPIPHHCSRTPPSSCRARARQQRERLAGVAQVQWGPYGWRNYPFLCRATHT